MISLTRTAAAPASPASRNIFSPAECGSALRVSLCPSATLLAILVFGLLVATAALWTTLASRIGGWHAAPAAIAFASAGALRAVSWCRAQTGVIEIGSDGIRVFNRDGTCLASGPMTGCSQWSTLFLVLAVGAARHRRRLFVAADALPAGAFREIAVRGRCVAGG